MKKTMLIFSLILCLLLTGCDYEAIIDEVVHEVANQLTEPEDVVEQMAAEELGQVINGFLRKLPRQQCSVFLQRYWYLDSIETIAERYGMSRSKVKSMLFRIRKRLKRYLEKEGYTV